MFYSDEAHLTINAKQINAFFNQQLKQDFLSTEHGTLYYGFAIPEQAKKAIVISSGRIESLFKYKELLWEFYQNGYAVFIVDHQGQGRSYRHLKNAHKGHVTRFTDYADDFAIFNEQVVNAHWQGQRVLLDTQWAVQLPMITCLATHILFRARFYLPPCLIFIPKAHQNQLQN